MFDQVFLSLTALISLILAVALLWRYSQDKHIHGLLFAVAAIVFFLAALLVDVGGLGVLSLWYVPVVSAVIPAFFADGLLFVAYKKKAYGNYYLVYSIIMIVLLALTKAVTLSTIATVVLIAIHTPSGIIMFLLPLILAFTKKTGMSGSLVGLGGLLIGIGGVALATLGAGVPILPAALVI